jgi:hypothetical protein
MCILFSRSYCRLGLICCNSIHKKVILTTTERDDGVRLERFVGSGGVIFEVMRELRGKR